MVVNKHPSLTSCDKVIEVKNWLQKKECAKIRKSRIGEVRTNHRRDNKENYRGRRISIPTDTLSIGVLGRPVNENFVIVICRNFRAFAQFHYE